MSPKVSIIVPVYGVERYIGRCASSLFMQTMQDLEFIFIDDCSPDRSIDVLEECIAEFPGRKEQVKIIRLERNGGVDNARRQGCFASSGAYVMFVDSDDTVEPDITSRMYDAAVSEDADLVCCRRKLLHEDGNIEESPLHDKVEDKDRYLGYMISMISDKACPNITNKLFSREVLQKVECLPAGNISEDWVICVQVVRHARKIVAMEDALYCYTIRQGSLTNTYDKAWCLESSIQDKANIDIVTAYLVKEGLADRYKHEINARKYVAKGSMAPFVEDDDFHRLWKDTYKEVNGSILFNPCMSFYDRKIFILRWFKLSSRYRRTMDGLKRMLGCKKR